MYASEERVHLCLFVYSVPFEFFLISVTSFFSFRSNSKDLMNSSSLAVSEAIVLVKTAFGDIENK